MISFFRLFIMGFCLWLVAWANAILALAAGISCEGWNTRAFFKRADGADVSRCLKIKNPNARDMGGWTPLHYAARFSKISTVVVVLMKGGAKANIRDASWRIPLHYAAQDNLSPAVLTALIKGGARVNVQDENGVTPLHFAAGDSKSQSIKLARLEAIFALLKTRNNRLKARNPSDKRSEKESSPSRQSTGFNKSPAVVRILLKAGAKVNARDKKGGLPCTMQQFKVKTLLS